MRLNAEQFYDSLADDYELNYADWLASSRRQAEALEGVLGSLGVEPGASLLDCTCGIGTQAIGLAERGWRVHGTDVSAASVRRAEELAGERGVELTTEVVDVRRLTAVVKQRFRVVLSADNSLPHLLTFADLLTATKEMRSILDPGGCLLISLRDYDQLRQSTPAGTPPTVVHRDGARAITFQHWAWTDEGAGYTVEHFTLKANGDDWDAAARTVKYRAWLRTEIREALEAADFTDVRWHEPKDTGFFQPIATAIAG